MTCQPFCRMNTAAPVSLFLICGCCVVSAVCQMQTAAAQTAAAKTLAYVGEMPITAADVDFQLGRAVRAGESLPDLPAAMLNSTVDMIASQRQALAALRKSKQAVSDQGVDTWLEANPPATDQPDAKLTAQQIVTAVCQQASLDERAYRDFVAFRLSWPEYVKKHLTESNVEKHFRRQTARFDGSQFEIEMLSIPMAAGASESRNQAASQLETIRANDDPAANFDGFAKANEGMELLTRRWVRASGDLDPRLVDTILELQDGELSPVLHTATGVHLIHRLASRRGERKLSEVRPEVRAHMLLFMLNHLAEQSREQMPFKAAP